MRKAFLAAVVAIGAIGLLGPTGALAAPAPPLPTATDGLQYYGMYNDIVSSGNTAGVWNKRDGETDMMFYLQLPASSTNLTSLKLKTVDGTWVADSTVSAWGLGVTLSNKGHKLLNSSDTGIPSLARTNGLKLWLHASTGGGYYLATGERVDIYLNGSSTYAYEITIPAH